MKSETVGEIETDEGVLVIRRIHVKLRLQTPALHRETAMRVHGYFAEHCPVYRTLKPAIAITTELLFDEES